MLDLHGIFVTTITPFKQKTYELDIQGARRNIEFLSESKKISGIVPIGTVGEFASLSLQERKELTENVIDAANGRKTIIVGVSHTNFPEVIELARHAKDCGADAVLVVPPSYYFKDTDAGLISFLELVSSQADIGMILYNIPGQSKVNLTTSLLSTILDRVENVVGIKDATKDLSQLAETIKIIGKRVPVVAGAEELSFYGLLAGAVGATSATANFAPHLIGDMYQNIIDGKIKEANSLFFGPILRFRHLDIQAVQQGISIQIVHTKETMN